MKPGDVVWTPSPELRRESLLARFLDRHGLADYDAAWRWSVSDLDGFWAAVWDWFEIRAETPYERVLGRRELPFAEWFPGARLNYAEHVLRGDDDAVAVVAHSQSRESFELTWGELREQVARARVGLQRLGVGPGDRVVAYLPNIPETLVAFLAASSLGAVWAVCPPEFGVRSVVDRLGQLEPRVLLTVGGYVYGDRLVDRRDSVAGIRAALPSLETVVHVPYAGGELPDVVPWPALLAEAAPLEFAPLPFDHPLCVLFSSGTTGLPKAIVHGHGGLLVEHCKNHGLSWDLRPGDRLLWFTTTAWMMWHALVSTLILRASIVMVDGSPGWPDLGMQWQLAQETRPTMMGVSPAFALSCEKAGIEPKRLDLSSLRSVGVAGSPLPVEGFEWLYDQLGTEVLLNLGSGGTDLCTGIVQGAPLLPVYAGEIAGRCLACDVTAFDPDGNEIVGELGELVIRQPMPSMALRFWGDEDGSRYRAAYFDMFPGVWRHGDWIRFSERGSSVITGRSDATLNRGGVRLGTSEFYSVLAELDEVLDSLVVHLEAEDELILFVVLREGVELDDALRKKLAAALRDALSPRHVPDTIEALPLIPMTLTGKKLELPVKKILSGVPLAEVVSPDALADPNSIDPLAQYARARSERPPRSG